MCCYIQKLHVIPVWINRILPLQQLMVTREIFLRTEGIFYSLLYKLKVYKLTWRSDYGSETSALWKMVYKNRGRRMYCSEYQVAAAATPRAVSVSNLIAILY